MARVLVVGSANLDLIATAERLPGAGETVMGDDYFEAAGGKGLNQAVAAARAGAAVTMIGAVGHDHAGEYLIGIMRDAGIDSASVARVDAPTGRALIGVGHDGGNLIIVVSGANALVSPEMVTLHGTAVGSADVVLAQHETPDSATVAAFRTARAVGAITILNPAPGRPVDPELLANTDVIVPNEHEVELLGGVATLAAAGVPHVVVTLGKAGADWSHGSGVTRIEPFAVDAVDTVAAGDAFCGVLAASLARGDAMADALRRASAAGALATTRRGAVPSLPTAAEIDALLSG